MVFTTTTGLLTADAEAKPSWYALNSWTDGDPEAVSLAQFPGSARLRSTSATDKEETPDGFLGSRPSLPL